MEAGNFKGNKINREITRIINRISYLDVADSLFELRMSLSWVIGCHGTLFVECDTHCTSGCSTRGAGKCDTTCASGYSLNETDYTCIGVCLLRYWVTNGLGQRGTLASWRQLTERHNVWVKIINFFKNGGKRTLTFVKTSNSSKTLTATL